MVEKLAGTINQNTEVLFEALNRKVSLRDNILCTVRDVDVTVGSTGVPTTSTSVGLDTTGKVDGVTVINCYNNDNTSLLPTAAPFIAYNATTTGINITNVKGLSAGSSWKLRVIIWQTNS